MKFGLSMTILFREFNELFQSVEKVDKIYLELIDLLTDFSKKNNFRYIN